MKQNDYQIKEKEIRDQLAYNYDERCKNSKGILFDSLEKSLFANNIPHDTLTLDLGCGTGRICEHVIKKTKELYACDFSEYSLKVLKQKNILNEKHIFKHDIKNPFPFGDNYFDIIYSCQVIQHLQLTDLLSSLTEIKRILKKHGKFIYIVYNGDCIFNKYREELLDNGLYIRRFDTSHIKYIANSIGLDLISIKYYNCNPALHKSSSKLNMLIENFLEKTPFFNRKLGKYIFVILENK